jgi:hypothetical protein
MDLGEVQETLGKPKFKITDKDQEILAFGSKKDIDENSGNEIRLKSMTKQYWVVVVAEKGKFIQILSDKFFNEEKIVQEQYLQLD